MYRTLSAEKIAATIDQLQARIEGRFPGCGLATVCKDLAQIARQTTAQIEAVEKPYWGFRISVLLFALAAIASLVFALGTANGFEGTNKISEVMQGLEAAMNLVIIFGGAAFFVTSLEARWKRRRALAAMHEIRSIIHVIDMHQLTKDPVMLGSASTSASPDRNMTPFELMRYLDYCSEMLSLAAKLAALYAEKLTDPAIIDTVGNIERLTSHLSSKIWQKITLSQTFEGQDALQQLTSVPAQPRQ